MKPQIRNAAVALTALIFAPAAARADAPELAEPSAADAESPRRMSAAAGIDVTSRYYFRGIVQERKGAIVQPMMELGSTLLEGGGPVSGLTLTTGLWTSLHSAAAAPSSETTGPSPWYEADFYVGLSVDLAADLAVSAAYTAYASPNSSFRTVHELGAAVSWDDGALWGDGRFSGLAPSAGVAVELANTAFGEDEGIYLEVGANPGFELFTSPAIGVSAAVPLTLGLSARDYYVTDAGENSPFGFFGAGLAVSADLGFIPASYGSWSVGLGGHLLVLGSATGAAAEAAGGGDTELVTLTSVAVSY